MAADSHESEFDTELMYFRSADETSPRFAPPDYRPRCVRGPVIYEDEIPDLPPRAGWDRDFDGGSSSSLIFLRANGNGELVRISKMDPFRTEWDIALYDQYTQENLWQSDSIENAYDAFWLADALVSGDKSPDDITDLLLWKIPPPPRLFRVNRGQFHITLLTRRDRGQAYPCRPPASPALSTPSATHAPTHDMLP